MEAPRHHPRLGRRPWWLLGVCGGCGLRALCGRAGAAAAPGSHRVGPARLVTGRPGRVAGAPPRRRKAALNAGLIFRGATAKKRCELRERRGVGGWVGAASHIPSTLSLSSLPAQSSAPWAAVRGSGVHRSICMALPHPPSGRTHARHARAPPLERANRPDVAPRRSATTDGSRPPSPASHALLLHARTLPLHRQRTEDGHGPPEAAGGAEKGGRG